jgi:phenylpropionate dioxygenase-like ring-hydroxylating dioxygenase large terminal subunit
VPTKDDAQLQSIGVASADLWSYSQSAAAIPGEARGLPREWYVDPERFQVEQRVLRNSWIPVARLDQLPDVGSYLTVGVAEEEFLVVRGHTDVAVFANVCRHRGMRLMAGEKGCASEFECEYHAWRYDLEGGFKGAPLMGARLGAERPLWGLRRFRSEHWLGWVFVNIDGDAPPMATEVSELAQRLMPWRLDEMETAISLDFECDWNWKITVDNFSEYYHHLGLHRESLEPLLPARSARSLDNAGQPFSHSVLRCSDEYLALQPTALRSVDADRASNMEIFCVFPLLCAGVLPSSAFWLQVLPMSVDRHQVRWHVLVPKGAQSSYAAFLDASAKELRQIQEEDARGCRGVQAGVRARGSAPGPFADLELPLWQFQEWLLERVSLTA